MTSSSISDRVTLWWKETLERDRLEYVRRRLTSHERQHRINHEIANLTHKLLNDRTTRQEMAQKMLPVVSADTPLGDWIESLESPVSPSLANGIARHYLPTIWETLKADVRDTGLPLKLRNSFLEHVTLANLADQEVFKTHIRRNDSDPGYLFLRQLASVVSNKTRLRPRHTEEEGVLDPSLEWLIQGQELKSRVDDLVYHTRGLAEDYQRKFKPKDEAAQAMRGDALRREAEEIHEVLSSHTTMGAYESIGCPRERHMTTLLREEMKQLLDDQLLDRLDAISEDEFRKRLKDAKGAFAHPPSQSHDIARRLTLTLQSEAAHRLQEYVRDWKEAYYVAVWGMRTKSLELDNELDTLDRRWTELVREVGMMGLPLMVVDFKRDHRVQFEWATQQSRFATATKCLADVEAAMKAPSTLASLTKAFSWRAQVRAAAQAAEVVVPPAVQLWFETEEKAVHDAEKSLQPVESKWRDIIQSVAQSMIRLSEIVDARFRWWQEHDRLDLARDLYEKRLSLLKRPDTQEKIEWSSWELMVECQPGPSGQWWKPDELALFNRVTPKLISWHDVQRCVLMMQWEESCVS